MNLGQLLLHDKSTHYANEQQIGFLLVSPRKGEGYEGRNYGFHSIVFVLEGEFQFSYDEYLNRHFKKGDLFLTPRAADIYGVALEDSLILVLTFNTHINLLFEGYPFSKQSKEVVYDFSALVMTPTIWRFAELMEEYINKNIHCNYIHQLKQKELFVLLQFSYTKEELFALLKPAIGEMTFKWWVIENYNLDLSMEMLAERCNMTPKSFSRKFKASFGTTFREWVVSQKVKHIRLRLSIPGTTFYDIIRDFKFTDLHYFYNFCKTHYGCTATELVEQLRNGTPNT